MKKFFVLMASVLLAALGMVFVACGEEGDVVSLSASSNIYSHGEQTVQITFSDLEEGDHKFEEDISVSGVSVGDGLVGKQVTAVAYVDDSTISVTLSGTVTGTVGNDGLLGYISVNGGISGNATGSAYLKAYKPQLLAFGATSGTVGEKHSYSSTFTLPYGSFVEEYVDTEHITLPDTNGVLEVSLTGNNLKISVKDFTLSEGITHPVVSIAPEVTTFNKQLYVYVGVNALQGSGYDLV